jgi:CDP-paratose 2-epimerase
MRIFIIGICGFVGSTLAKALLESSARIQIFGVDNFIRPGSELTGAKIFYADVPSATDFEPLPAADYVIHAAGEPRIHE